MKIALLNGSPRGRKAASEWILNKLTEQMGKNNELEKTIEHYYLVRTLQTDELEKILENDVIVLAYPNYFGTMPAEVMENMICLEQTYHKMCEKGKHHPITVYVIINCGFYYSTENNMAMDIMYNWCKKAGFSWGKGISYGGGSSFTIMDNIPPARFILLSVYRSFRKISEMILENKPKCSFEEKENILNKNWNIQIFLTCRVFVFIAEKVWCIKAKKNGLRPCDL